MMFVSQKKNKKKESDEVTLRDVEREMANPALRSRPRGGTPWNPQWDQIIEKALPPEMLSSQVPQDVRRFCPQFYELGETDKRAFWAYFFQALAGAEAGLNPKARARHNEPEVAKRDEVSGLAGRTEGLLQLTYADQKRYACDFNWKLDRTLKVADPEAYNRNN
jgi:hypothetical protein